MRTGIEPLFTAGRALFDRQQFLSNSATAQGSIALTNSFGLDGLLVAPGPIIDSACPYALRQPHFSAKARNVTSCALMTPRPSWRFCIDIGWKNAGEVSGTMNMACTAITALALFCLPDGSRGAVAFFHPAVALIGAGIMCWLAADSSRKMEAQA